MAIQLDTNLMPTQKITAAALGGAVATLLVWALQSLGHVAIPPGVEAAFATIVTVLVGYFKIEPNG